MLGNLRRKSLAVHYYSSRKAFVLKMEQGHVIYLDAYSIAWHKQRLSKEKKEKSFLSTFDSVSKKFRLVSNTLNRVVFNMIYCPAGTFIMGHEEQEDNLPRPEIIERSFLLGETEITQELYKKVMNTNPSEFKNNSENPVESVSWEDAILFCNELSRQQGLDLCYAKNSDEEYDWACDFSKNGYRLPTEKEWEYAAKAGTNNKYAGTDNYKDLENYAVYEENSRIGWTKQTHPVKSKLPNGWGFYDMSGNVDECCWDKYDPDNLDTSAPRVERGGSWNAPALSLRSAVRGSIPSGYRGKSSGIRVCRSIVN